MVLQEDILLQQPLFLLFALITVLESVAGVSLRVGHRANLTSCEDTLVRPSS